MDSQEELTEYLSRNYKGEEADFLLENVELGQIYFEKVIDGYRTKYNTEPNEEIKSAMGFTGGYYSAVLPILIYEQYIFPLINEIEKYYKLMIASFVLLLISTLLILTAVSFDTIKVFIFLILPAIIGMAIATLKGIKIWSEVKKNLLEVKKLERELE